MAAERCENSAIRASGTPVTSKRSCSEWRRDRPSQPHPNSLVNRSLSTPWCSSERATTRLEQAPRIERPPRAVGDRAGPVGHHHMVVELGVPGPRIPMGEGGGHDSFNVFLDHAVGARARVEHLALGVGEHDLDGAAMAGVDLCLGVPVGQCPGRGYRLGWREGQVEPGDGRTEGSSLGPFLGLDAGLLLGPFGAGVGGRNGGNPLRYPLGQGEVGAVGLAAEWLAGDRVGAHPEQVEQVLLGHLPTRPRPRGRRRGRPGRRPRTRRAGFPTRRSSGSGSRMTRSAPSPTATDSIR